MPMKPPLHKHVWERRYHSLQGQVDRCSCGEFSTVLWDYASRKEVRMPGNLLSPILSDSVVYVVCRDRRAFQRVQEQLKENLNSDKINLRYLTDPLDLHSSNHPIVYFYGDWWENPIIESVEITRYINGWL